jgi:hypothetical protein
MHGREAHAMAIHAAAGATVLAAATVLGIAVAAPAEAAICDPPVSGTYTAVSDGQWAQTNDSYHDEATVTATWTVTSMCADHLDCTGRVVSSTGWSADIQCGSGLWKVRRQIDGWEQCQDGTSVPGQQTYYFFNDVINPANFAGWDKTVGPSGGCGRSNWLTINMPFKLIKQ